jgi:hypothetical protein
MSRSSSCFIQVLAHAVHGLCRARLVVIPAVLCGLALATPRISSQASTNTLQQGIDTIRQILAKDGLYSRSTTSARNNYKSLTEKTFSLSAAAGCKLVVESDSHAHIEEPTQNRVSDRKSTEVFHPDFSVMDSASVYVGDPEPPQPTWEAKGYLVRISVEVGKPLIVASAIDKEHNAARDMPGLPALAVYVSSRAAADRLAAAFKQVATACRASGAAK